LKVRMYNQLDRWSLRAAHTVVAVCSAFGRDLVRTGIAPERIAVRHNMIWPFVPPPASAVQELRTRLGLPERAQVILCVGRFSPEKGHLDLLRAVAMLNQAHPFRLVLVGDGAERSSLEREIVRLGLQGRVILAGHQPDVNAYYAMADVLALPSHSEGSPNVLLEAMAAGLPVVATAVGGVPEIVTHEESALLVDERSPEKYRAALARLLTDEQLRKRLAASALQATERFTPEAYVSGILEIYRKTLATAAEGGY